MAKAQTPRTVEDRISGTNRRCLPQARLWNGWDGPKLGPRSGEVPAARVSPRRRSGVADQRGVHVVQPPGAPHGPLPLVCSMQVADATGYPLSPSHVLRQVDTLVCSVILARAPRLPVLTGTHGESPAMAGRILLTVHGNTSQLTSCDSPLLCKAVLGSLRACTQPKKPSPAGRSLG
jgi:hypothetical protein